MTVHDDRPGALDDSADSAMDSLWAGSVGSLKLSLILASLILSIAEVARARKGDGVSLHGALGLYLQVSVVSVAVANALRSTWKWALGALGAAYLSAIAPALVTLWLLERVELRTAEGAARLMVDALALAAMLAVPIGIALWRTSARSDARETGEDAA